MELTQEHIDFMRLDLTRRGVALDALCEDLIDHICCQIETSGGTDFETAYRDAIRTFGDISHLQKETYNFIHKKEIIMKKTAYLLGYIATTLCTSGLLFKIMHWPGANVLLLTGVALLNFGFLPLYFYQKSKSAMA